MPQRIVVSFRGPIVADLAAGKKYLDRALSLKKRAEALGATLCAWSAATFSFDFEPDDLEEATSLALSAQEGVPAEERFGIGIALGEMSTVGEGGSLAALSWGLPLCAAVALARDARAGEALLDPELVSERFASLSELGYDVSLDRDRRVLAPRHPALLPAATEAPPRPPPAATTPPPSAKSWPSLRPPASGTQGGSLQGGPLQSGTTLRPPAVPTITTPRTLPPPPLPFSSTITAPPPRLAPIAPPPPSTITSPPPSVRATRAQSEALLAAEPEVSDQLAELAKRALVQGDMSALEGLIAQLRVRGEHGDLVERMTGLAALRRGATAEALRRLRAAAEEKKDPAQQARARLAYGVALATAGRNESALLEVLQALSRARAASDAQGERACALFLARLSTVAGHADAASAWTTIAARKAEPAPPS